MEQGRAWFGLQQKVNDVIERLERLEEREFKAPTCQKLNDRLNQLEKIIRPDVKKVKEALDELVKQAQELKMGY